MQLPDYLVTLACLAVVIYIGFRTRRAVRNSEDFLLSRVFSFAMTT